MPVYKYRDYIFEAIESLKEQTDKDFELIIVSDRDKDKYSLLKEDFIKHIYLDKEEHPALKINIGFNKSSGKYITILSDDDMLDKYFVENMTSKISDGYDVVYSDMEVFGTKNYICPASDKWTLSQFRVSTVPYITSMVTREMFIKVSGYSVIGYYDWDFWFKCFECGAKPYHLKETLFRYRSSEENISSFTQNPTLKEEILNKHEK